MSPLCKRDALWKVGYEELTFWWVSGDFLGACLCWEFLHESLIAKTLSSAEHITDSYKSCFSPPSLYNAPSLCTVEVRPRKLATHSRVSRSRLIFKTVYSGISCSYGKTLNQFIPSRGHCHQCAQCLSWSWATDRHNKLPRNLQPWTPDNHMSFGNWAWGRVCS